MSEQKPENKNPGKLNGVVRNQAVVSNAMNGKKKQGQQKKPQSRGKSEQGEKNHAQNGQKSKSGRSQDKGDKNRSHPKKTAVDSPSLNKVLYPDLFDDNGNRIKPPQPVFDQTPEKKGLTEAYSGSSFSASPDASALPRPNFAAGPAKSFATCPPNPTAHYAPYGYPPLHAPAMGQNMYGAMPNAAVPLHVQNPMHMMGNPPPLYPYPHVQQGYPYQYAVPPQSWPPDQSTSNANT